MEPTLKPGGSVLVSALPYLFASPKTGDIVACRDPDSKKVLIKRITKIENNRYFLEGDNKTESTDSRNFGWLDKETIIGKVICIL